MEYTYYRLLDKKYNGYIVRSKKGKNEYYDVNCHQWNETGLMIRYYSDESDQYDMFEELTKEEVQAIIQQSEVDD